MSFIYFCRYEFLTYVMLLIWKSFFNVASKENLLKTQPRDWTWVSCIAGRFFTIQATREANDHHQFSSVHSLSRVWLFATPWTAAHQASLSITNSRNWPKLMTIESVMTSNHLILCYPLLLLPSIFSNIRIFSSESGLRIKWPKYWSFSFNISPSNGYSRFDFL